MKNKDFIPTQKPNTKERIERHQKALMIIGVTALLDEMVGNRPNPKKLGYRKIYFEIMEHEGDE